MAKITGAKTPEVAGGCRELHNELYDLYHPQNIFTIFKLSKIIMREACNTHENDAYCILNFTQKPERKYRSEDIVTEEGIILKKFKETTRENVRLIYLI